MNRFRKAWLTLTEKSEPEAREIEKRVEVPVIGEAHKASLFVVVVPNGRMKTYADVLVPDYNRSYFGSCEQAHAEHPDLPVYKVEAIRVGQEFFIGKDLRAVTVQPKPKREKGKRAK